MNNQQLFKDLYRYLFHAKQLIYTKELSEQDLKQVNEFIHYAYNLFRVWRADQTQSTRMCIDEYFFKPLTLLEVYSTIQESEKQKALELIKIEVLNLWYLIDMIDALTN